MLFVTPVVKQSSDGKHIQCVLFFLIIHCTVLRSSVAPLFMIDNLIHLKMDRMLNNRHKTQHAK